MAGITATGVEAKRTEEIKTDLEDAFRSEIDPKINTSSASLAGQFIGILSSALAEVWELLQAAWSGQQIATAEGFALDNQVKLLGVSRIAASASSVVLTLNLDAGTTVPAGSRVQVDGDENIQFTTDEEVENTGGAAADFEVSATATENGPLRANAGTVTVIVDTVSGWNTVTNDNDAEPGAFTESDAELRERYFVQLFQVGGSTPDAIRADVLALSGIQQATVFENVTSSVDANGLPPHSIEVVIFDGVVPVVDDDLIAQTIWNTKAAGIATYGDESGTATDGNGDSQTVYFSRTDVLEVWLEVDIEIRAADYPGADAVKAALVNFGDAQYVTGSDVISAALHTPVFSVEGVRNITEIRLGLSASPTLTDDLTIQSRQLAKLDTTRILITVV